MREPTPHSETHTTGKKEKKKPEGSSNQSSGTKGHEQVTPSSMAQLCPEHVSAYDTNIAGTEQTHGSSDRATADSSTT